MEPQKNSKINKLFQLLRNNFTKKKSGKLLNTQLNTTEIKKEFKRKLELPIKKKPELPRNYADDLLNLELEIEEIDPPTLPQVKKLLELYIIGVEYHEAIHSQRYLIFKNKINILMSKPKILEILNEEQSREKLEKTLDSERAWVSKQEKKKSWICIYF